MFRPFFVMPGKREPPQAHELMTDRRTIAYPHSGVLAVKRTDVLIRTTAQRSLGDILVNERSAHRENRHMQRNRK